MKGDCTMRIYIFLFVLMMILTGCLKENQCMDSGTITGTDPRDCMCCGGWFIEIKDTLRRFDQVPADCVIDFNAVAYPLRVKLEWKKKDVLCLGDEIKVLRMELE